MSVNSKMTAIADKIRTLRGISGPMGLDTMATHIGNEQTAITAALAALTEKGVEVPAGSTSDALAGVITAIESGGMPVVAYGTITPSEDTEDDYTLDTGINLSDTGDKNYAIVLYLDSMKSPQQGSIIYAYLYRKTAVFYSVGIRGGYNELYKRTGSSYYSYNYTNLTFKSFSCSKNFTFGMKAGDTYRWIMVEV